jgi:lipopolysaccharide export system permease protein
LNRLDRYVARTLLATIGLVMAVLLVLGGLFLFMDEQRSVGVGRYGVSDALLHVLLSLPRFALEALPVGVLIGALLGIGTLARSHEITVMRAAGVSRRRLAWSALLAGLVVFALALLVGEYLAPRLEQIADERKAFAKYENVSFAGRSGAWLRDGDTVLNVEQRSTAGQYGGMLVFELTDDNRIAAIGSAERATTTTGQSWQLADYRESRFAGDAVNVRRDAGRTLRSAAGGGFLQLTLTMPDKLALGNLQRAIAYRRANDLDVTTYQFAFWSRLARLAAVLVGVVFAVPFGFGSMRSSGTGARMTLGLAIGIVYFFLQRMVESGSLVFNASPALMAWMPTLLLALAASVLLARAR